jgi:hypothetical protein
MKEFKDNYEPIKFKLIDVDGNEHEVESKFMSTEQYVNLENLIKDKKKTSSEIAIESMIKSCGKDAEFWGKFSMGLLLDVSKYIASELSKKKQKNGSTK